MKNLGNILRKAEETLLLRNNTRNLKRRFPLFYNKLNKDHLIIYFTIIFTYYNRLGFTAITMIISNKILFNIYKKEILMNKNKYIISFDMYLESLNLNNKGEQLKLGAFFIEIEIFCVGY